MYIFLSIRLFNFINQTVLSTCAKTVRVSQYRHLRYLISVSLSADIKYKIYIYSRLTLHFNLFTFISLHLLKQCIFIQLLHNKWDLIKKRRNICISFCPFSINLFFFTSCDAMAFELHLKRERILQNARKRQSRFLSIYFCLHLNTSLQAFLPIYTYKSFPVYLYLRLHFHRLHISSPTTMLFVLLI